SARALADDLNRYLDGEPIEARRTPFWERGAKWARRRPATALSVASILVALLGTVGGLFAYQESLVRRGPTLLSLLDQGYGLERKADAARSSDAWRKVQLEISGFLPRLAAVADDPRVKDLRGRLEKQSEALATQIEDDRVKQARHLRLAAERGRF